MQKITFCFVFATVILPGIYGFECTNRPNGNYPDLENCGQFFSCSGEVKWVLFCPDNLHFDPNSNKCEYPDIVNCPNYKMPANCQLLPNNVVISTNSVENCKSYLKCIDGNGLQETCPAGQLFNPKQRACDAAENVKC